LNPCRDRRGFGGHIALLLSESDKVAQLLGPYTVVFVAIIFLLLFVARLAILATLFLLTLGLQAVATGQFGVTSVNSSEE
jgi:hypothetical protein